MQIQIKESSMETYWTFFLKVSKEIYKTPCISKASFAKPQFPAAAYWLHLLPYSHWLQPRTFYWSDLISGTCSSPWHTLRWSFLWQIRYYFRIEITVLVLRYRPVAAAKRFAFVSISFVSVFWVCQLIFFHLLIQFTFHHTLDRSFQQILQGFLNI